MTGPAGDTADAAMVVMPYRRWRRWVGALRVRSLLQAGGSRGDRAVLVYGIVLVLLMYGPMLWTVLAQAGASLGGGTPGAARQALLALVLGVVGASCVLGVLAARAGGPLWVSGPEVSFALSGQFSPRAVLWGRGAAVAVGTALVAGFVTSAVAAGMLATDGLSGAAGAVAAWGVCCALGVQAALAVGVAAQTPRWQRAAQGTAGAIATVSLLVLVASFATERAEPAISVHCLDPATVAAATCPVDAGPGAAALVGAALAAVVSLVIALRFLPDAVDVDAAAAGRNRAVAVGAGLASGDASGVARVLGPARFARRRATFPTLLIGRAPLVARDLLGLSRRPLALVGSLPTGVAGAALVAVGVSPEAPAITVVAGGVLLYAASATWASGLRELAGQPVPGGLLPGTVARTVAGHAVVSVLLGFAVAAAGLLVAVAVAGPAGVGSAVRLAGILSLVLAVRLWVSGATTAPAELFTPVSTPAGDASQVVLAAWYLRGWLTVIGGAWALHRFGAVALVLLLVVAVALVRAAVSRLERA